MNLEVLPLPNLASGTDGHFLILFEPVEAGPTAGDSKDVNRTHGDTPIDEANRETRRMKAELTATEDYLQSLLADHQSTTDELAAANEELIASNEELQSINEELQSAKEELQSTNEELSTVNDQLRHRNLELDQVANDLINILASVELPVIIVDTELRVRRFTPAAKDIAHFILDDVGRPIDDFKLNIAVDDLPGRIRSVLASLSTREWSVQGPQGRWFRMLIRPYCTSDNRLDGAVITFTDVDVLRRAAEEAEHARDYARSIVETVNSALVVLNDSLHVVSANTAFYDTFFISAADAESRSLAELNQGLWSLPALEKALQDALVLRRGFVDLELRTQLPVLGARTFSLSGRPILWGTGAQMVLLAIDDVTALRALESERNQLLASEKKARIDAERATRAKDAFLATLSHELRTPLSTMLLSAQVLRNMAPENPAIDKPSAAIERAAGAQARLIDDLLDVSRIVSGKLMLDLGPSSLTAIVREAVEVARPAALAKGLDLGLSLEDGVEMTVYGDEHRLLQVVNNLLTNAIKFTPQGGRIFVKLARTSDCAELTVEDTGMGIREDVLPRLFGRFVQADTATTRTYGGLGLGLSIVRHLVEVHGGKVEVESQGEGKGATFRVTLPLGPSSGASAGTPKAHTAGRIDGLRVLLVEDDEDTRAAYEALLRELGAEVNCAASAAAGLAALRVFKPQVLLSDIAMPSEDGFSFISRVRRLPPEEGGLVPAAALTALASEDDEKHALAAGFQMHCKKPVDASLLASIVRQLAARDRLTPGR